jgi:hypothetical protein
MERSGTGQEVPSSHVFATYYPTLKMQAESYVETSVNIYRLHGVLHSDHSNPHKYKIF